MFNKLPVLLGGLIFFSLFFISPKQVFGQVIINEFSSSTLNDWVEVINVGVDPVDLSSYRLRDTSTNKVDLSGTLDGGAITSFNFGKALNKDGDIVKLYSFSGEVETLKDSIPYGTSGGVCVPSETGSIGRYPDANSTIERFSTSTRDLSNNSAALDPCSTPTPEPTPTPSPTPKPTSTPAPTIAPTKTPTSTVKATSTSKPTVKPTNKKVSLDSEDSEKLILGLREELEESPSPDKEEEEVKKKFPWYSLFFIIPGAGFIGYPAFLFLRKKQKGYTSKSEDASKNT